MSCRRPSAPTPTAKVSGRCLPISSTMTTKPAPRTPRSRVKIRYAGSHRLGGRPSSVRTRARSSGVATTVCSATAPASGNSALAASSARMNTPSWPATPAGPTTSSPPASPPARARNRRREILLEAERDPEEEGIRRVLAAPGRQEVRHRRQALAAVRPRPLQRGLDDEQGHRAVGQTERYAVDPAVLAVDAGQVAAREVDLLDEAVQPHLFAAQRDDELRVLEGLAQRGVPQEVGEEAVAQV